MSNLRKYKAAEGVQFVAGQRVDADGSIELTPEAARYDLAAGVLTEFEAQADAPEAQSLRRGKPSPVVER